MRLNWTEARRRTRIAMLQPERSGRLLRVEKTVISAELANIFERLGTSADSWWSRLEKLSQGRLLGRYFATKRERLRELAGDLGGHPATHLRWVVWAI